MNRVLRILLCVSIALLVHHDASAQRPIGMNLAPINTFQSQIIYTDAFFLSRHWLTNPVNDRNIFDGGETVPLRADGYPTQIPFVGSGGDTHEVKATFFSNIEGNYPAGNYTLTAEGTGTIWADQDATFTILNAPGSISVPVNPGSSAFTLGIQLRIVASDSTDPVRNIRMFLPGHSAASDSLYPTFLQRVQGFKALRMMDLTNINLGDYPCDNGGPVTSASCVMGWDSRALPGDADVSHTRGFPFEYQVEIANRANIPPWFNVPHAATDTFVTSMASLIRTQLNPSLNFYIELSNETWNPDDAFPQSTYYENLGAAQALGGDSRALGNRAYVKRLAEVINLFRQEFVGQEGRILRVMGAAFGDTGWTIDLMNNFNSPGLNPTGQNVDYLAMGAYWGIEVIDQMIASGQAATATADDLMDSAEWGLTKTGNNVIDPSDPFPSFQSYVVAGKATADSFGIPMIAYEGGQSLGTFSGNTVLDTEAVIANRSQRMGNLYDTMFKIWFDNGGETFLVYVFTQRYPHAAQTFGHLEYQDQPISEAPKYLKIMELLNATGIQFGDTTGPVIETPVFHPQLFRRGRGDTITAVVYDETADSGYRQVNLWGDTGTGTFLPVAGTTSDTADTRIFAFFVPDTMVASGDTFLYFIVAEDSWGNRTLFGDTTTPRTVPLFDSFGVSLNFAPADSFASDSNRLSNGTWSSPSNSNFALLILAATGDTYRIEVIGDIGFAAETAVILLNDSVVREFESIANGTVLFDSVLPLRNETNTLTVIFTDTHGALAPATETGLIFVDASPPTVADPDSLLNGGARVTDTVAVVLSFDSSAGGVADTGPGGVSQYRVSDTSAFESSTNTSGPFNFTETASFQLNDSFISAATEIATVYFEFSDTVGNRTIVSDTIIIDRTPPEIRSDGGATIGVFLERVMGLSFPVRARLTDTAGIQTAQLYVRHRPDTLAYEAVGMTLISGTVNDGLWEAIVPDTLVGAVEDTSIGVEYYISCTDVAGRDTQYRSAASPESVSIVGGVTGRVWHRLFTSGNDMIEITQAGTLASRDTAVTLRITSNEADTVRILLNQAEVFAGYSPDFGDTTITVDTNFATGDSVVVILEDTSITVPFADTYSFLLDTTPLQLTAFDLVPVRSALDTFVVTVSLSSATAGNNVRLFISQIPDTLTGAINDTTVLLNGSTFGPFTFSLNPALFTGDTANMFASAWDAAGNAADTVQLSFVFDSAAPVVTASVIPDGRPANDSVTFTVTIADTTLSLGLDTAVFTVAKDTGATDTYPLTQIQPGVYTGVVPAAKVGSAAGTVAIRIIASDTFGRSGDTSFTFTVSPSTLLIGDSTTSLTAAETVTTNASTGYAALFVGGDTFRVLGTGVDSSTTAVDIATLSFPLQQGTLLFRFQRISVAGDSQEFVRWFVVDTSAPVVTSVQLDSGSASTADTEVVLTIAATDSSLPMTYRFSGDVTDTDAGATLALIGTSLYRTISLTAGDDTKTVSVVVSDALGNAADTLTASIILTASAPLDSLTFRAVFDTATGETVAVTDTIAAGETRAVLQETNDTLALIIPEFSTGSSDTMEIRFDFAAAIINSVIRVAVPDTAALSSEERRGNLAVFEAGRSTMREITITDSAGAMINDSPAIYDGIVLTLFYGDSLLPFQDDLEVFYFNEPQDKWALTRTDSDIVQMFAVDSYVHNKTNRSFAVKIRHFTIFGVFPAAWAAQASVDNVIVYPNPYVPHDGNQANGEFGTATEGIRIGNLPAGSRIDIYDIQGRRIDEVRNTGNTGLAVWDTRDLHGREVASGTYLIVVNGGGGKVVKKVAIVR